MSNGKKAVKSLSKPVVEDAITRHEISEYKDMTVVVITVPKPIFHFILFPTALLYLRYIIKINNGIKHTEVIGKTISKRPPTADTVVYKVNIPVQVK